MEIIQSVINRKSLEKQLKLVQTKIESLEMELTELDKIRQACLVLMGPDSQEPKSKPKVDEEEKSLPEVEAVESEAPAGLSN